MNRGKLAKKYARTLFHAVEFGALEEALKQLEAVEKAMSKSRDIFASLTSPLFTAGEKAKAISAMAGALGLSPEVENFLNHLADKGAASLLDDIVVMATRMYNEKKRKAVATVLTPVPFSGALQERLSTSLKHMTKRDEIDIEYVLDPTLLGGFVVKIGSTMYDSSLKGQLRLLKEELIKG